MATSVYVDGFNLFRGCLKGSGFKWLNLEQLCDRLFPNDQITRIRYFTAMVLPFPHNADAPTNQLVYLRALATLPRVTIHRDGWFASHPVVWPEYPLSYPNGPSQPPKRTRVLKLEEKRTDVEIATHLLVDCFDNEFDHAVVISNDSDLAAPVAVVRDKFGKRVTTVNPHKRWKVSRDLVRASSDYVATINTSVLRRCQFPDTLSDTVGTFRKPPTW